MDGKWCNDKGSYEFDKSEDWIDKKRLRLFDEAFDIQCILLALQIHRDIPFKLASADINDLHLNVFLSDTNVDEVAHRREVIAFHGGLFIVDAALLALLLLVEFLQMLLGGKHSTNYR